MTKSTGNCVFPQNFYTRKSGGINIVVNTKNYLAQLLNISIVLIFIYKKTYLEPSQTSTMELFCENSQPYSTPTTYLYADSIYYIYSMIPYIPGTIYFYI